MRKISNHTLRQESLLAEIQHIMARYYRLAIKDPQWLFMSILGRSACVRDFVRWVSLSESAPIFSEESEHLLFNHRKDVDSIISSLQRDGLFLGLQLSENITQEILDFAKDATCYANGQAKLGFKIQDKPWLERNSNVVVSWGQYFNTNQLCPAIRKLRHAPFLREISRQYLGRKPVFTGSRLWWLFACDQDNYNFSGTASYFHYDIDDYSSLRFFFYLTDVDYDSGPHVCVTGSHNQKRFIDLLSPMKRCSDQHIYKHYPEQDIVTVIGKAGFGFAENMVCYHKASRPKQKDRLMLELRFAAKDYGIHHDVVNPAFLKQIRLEAVDSPC